MASLRVPLANYHGIHKSAPYDIIKISPLYVPPAYMQEAAHVAASSRLEACSLLFAIRILTSEAAVQTEQKR